MLADDEPQVAHEARGRAATVLTWVNVVLGTLAFIALLTVQVIAGRPALAALWFVLMAVATGVPVGLRRREARVTTGQAGES
jgi:hypothetical protein